MRLWRRPLLLLAFVLAACRGESSGGAVGTIEGRVSLGPIMPVCREGVPCDGVYAGANVVVSDKSGNVAARGTTSPDGLFELRVRAGSYVVRVDVEGPLPRCSQTDVVVASGQTVEVAIDCDSGIR